ncbi:glycosyltransferase family 2 protein [Ancylobacter vacuolatus]|uniref:Glycosyltransferase involved in cell wall biosynthesis n=1 Tax=Ancylobacter vacuolatus TaxID=223389 RepID=A0ABU0DD63_9HYPH|nr:glycosyltransferase family 2 protein [Ancylobacter vacuolatus]MDQ0346349.1 glycosyltransferase involved in cell wall biosynthesis [Ancylobacter vacuolatus]
MGRLKTVHHPRIAQTELFDAAWYWARHPDLSASPAHLLDHYLTIGWKQGADPSPYFDGAHYLATHPDVAAAGLNPLLHYALWGEAEGRAIRPVDAADARVAEVAFSVILATYNRAGIIEQAIDSVLAQTHGNFELVIVDDGSTDGTQERLNARYGAELAQGRLVYLRFSRNLGISAARNAGLLVARHPWIAYIDSDNTIRPHFLDSFARRIVGRDGAMTFYSRFHRASEADILGGPFDLEALQRANYIDLGVFVHHIACFHELGGFDLGLRRLVDWDVILKYVRRYTPAYITEVLLDYRNGDGSALNRITTHEPFSLPMARILRRHGLRTTVTTVIICYNQKDFIAQAIESALAQVGDFFHDIVIADDGSTDGTADIARDFCARHPFALRMIGDGTNRGISGNFQRAFAAAGGEFLAVLEGDDYWTDPAKLARQIAFLRKNADCSMVFSKIEIETPGTPGRATLPRQDKLRKSKLDGADFLAEPSLNLIANFSCCLFRSDAMKTLPNGLFRHRLSEIALAFHLERLGPIGYLNQPMSVYRQHPQGVWTGASPQEQRASGRRVREAAKAVAREQYRPALQAIIDARYAPAPD